MTNLDDLHLFVSLVNAGSFTLAAKELGIAKSKVSRRLYSLEQSLGTELLLRTTRKQELTESGRLLYCSTKEHIDALSTVEEELSSSINEPQGKLNILLPLEFFNRIISVLISDFSKKYPKISINCQHYSGTIPEFDPKFDLCFVLHEQALPASNWVARELVSFPQSIYSAMDSASLYHISDQSLVNLENLADFDCILAEENQVWHFRHKQTIEQISIKGQLILSSPEMRLQACVQGLGFCKLPDYVINHSAQDPSVQRVTLSAESVAQRLSVLYQSRKIPVKTRTFLDYFQSHVGQLL